MRLIRGNSWAELERAPHWFCDAIKTHLAVPVELAQFRLGARFGSGFAHGDKYYGSLVHGGRYVAAGLTPHVMQLAQHYRLACEYVDRRPTPMGGYPWHSMQAQWRPYQERVHKSCIDEGCGVIDAPPRSGKTNMSARLIDVYGVPCVYIAPSLPIVKQTYDRFCEWFGEGLVARLDGEASEREKDISKPIVIATAASVVRQPPEWWRTRELLIIDEFHHAAAETYHQINALAEHIYFRFCFTGTHFRTGEDALAMQAVCSQVLAQISVEELVAQKYLAAPRVIFARAPGVAVGNLTNYVSLYQKGIVENEARNQLVVEIVGMLQERGVPTIVLTRRRKHADLFGDRIPNSVVVKGGEQVLTGKAVKDFAAGRYEVLVGTTVIGEGVDLPRAAALVYASGGGGGVGQMQSYFRPLTGVEGKTHGRIYDLWDSSGQILSGHSQDRFEYARTYLGASSVTLS